ncbi:neurogenic locus notch homolog protein 3-like [Anneissia japonica]|uniref:neurogenic locus notch homolog protein 3-like n=1 Tax=Anneissia japonica TaxID=1529436 RepID=UPI001425AF8D|nr:neurogenic locus notch homolog protein 3-like [Anneissia japonica]
MERMIQCLFFIVVYSFCVEARRSALFTYSYTEPPTPPMRNCPCGSNPCDNFGVCVNEPTNSFRCDCQGNWMGPTCDDCLPPATLVCKNNCPYKPNLLCNDGGIGSATSFCAAGTDCNNCGARCLLP